MERSRKGAAPSVCLSSFLSLATRLLANEALVVGWNKQGGWKSRIYMSDLSIKYINPKELIPYENNPRINDQAVEAVKASIMEFGFKVPIVIDKDNVIICGHTRQKAALELHMSSVPCTVADDLTDEQIRAFRLADNKTAELADWDFDLLNEEIQNIFDSIT